MRRDWGEFWRREVHMHAFEVCILERREERWCDEEAGNRERRVIYTCQVSASKASRKRTT
jgi:hypothetical protein